MIGSPCSCLGKVAAIPCVMRPADGILSLAGDGMAAAQAIGMASEAARQRQFDPAAFLPVASAGGVGLFAAVQRIAEVQLHQRFGIALVREITGQAPVDECAAGIADGFGVVAIALADIAQPAHQREIVKRAPGNGIQRVVRGARERTGFGAGAAPVDGMRGT